MFFSIKKSIKKVNIQLFLETSINMLHQEMAVANSITVQRFLGEYAYKLLDDERNAAKIYGQFLGLEGLKALCFRAQDIKKIALGSCGEFADRLLIILGSALPIGTCITRRVVSLGKDNHAFLIVSIPQCKERIIVDGWSKTIDLVSTQSHKSIYKNTILYERHCNISKNVKSILSNWHETIRNQKYTDTLDLTESRCQNRGHGYSDPCKSWFRSSSSVAEFLTNIKDNRYIEIPKDFFQTKKHPFLFCEESNLNVDLTTGFDKFDLNKFYSQSSKTQELCDSINANEENMDIENLDEESMEIDKPMTYPQKIMP